MDAERFVVLVGSLLAALAGVGFLFYLRFRKATCLVQAAIFLVTIQFLIVFLLSLYESLTR